MGTRGTITLKRGSKKVVLYNHWDSYPSGLGIDLLNMIKKLLEKYGEDGLKERFEKIRIVDDSIRPTEEDIKVLEPYTNLGVGSTSIDDWYCLLRNIQGDIFKMIEVGYMYDQSNVGSEEFDYILDFDEMTIGLDGYKQYSLFEIDSIYKEWKEDKY